MSPLILSQKPLEPDFYCLQDEVDGEAAADYIRSIDKRNNEAVKDELIMIESQSMMVVYYQTFSTTVNGAVWQLETHK
jgi:hypothetical protein